MLREALLVYQEVAYAGQQCPCLPPFVTDQVDDLESALAQFVNETREREGGARRYILRLGNRRYPFMKFVLEEHLIRGEFFLSVDTHDQMFRAPSTDATEFAELQVFNAQTKAEIEGRWREYELPTSAHLKGLMETRLLPTKERRNQRVLVVDDDLDAADTMELLLQAQGFDVDLAANGQEAVEKTDPKRHALVLMDFEMPVMDGLEACRRLKEQESTRPIPVLLATAGTIDLNLVREADAFLVKPFQADILFSFLEHLLSNSEGEPPAASRGASRPGSTPQS
jgi:CheY-like chemotaxis protein